MQRIADLGIERKAVHRVVEVGDAITPRFTLDGEVGPLAGDVKIAAQLAFRIRQPVIERSDVEIHARIERLAAFAIDADHTSPGAQLQFATDHLVRSEVEGSGTRELTPPQFALELAQVESRARPSRLEASFRLENETQAPWPAGHERARIEACRAGG